MIRKGRETVKRALNTESDYRGGTLRTLIWKRPVTLWLLPAVFLFLTTIVPLAGNHYWFIDPMPWVHGLVLLLMSFIVAHQYFSFMHRVPASDFYFSLPAGRTRLFFGLNLGALACLLGPSFVMAALHFALRLLRDENMPSLPFAVSHGYAAYWTPILSLWIRMLIFFFMMLIFYLITEKTTTAVTLFLLVNAFWPAVILLFTDATASFLPGFIAPSLTSEAVISPWIARVIQIFSPVSAFFQESDTAFSWFTLLLLALTFLTAWALFRIRPAENSRQSGRFNWPQTITQWMVVLAVSLLGGYAGHYLRVITTLSAAGQTAVSSPLPFLIGVFLGLILSLWAFNLFHGKGRIRWKALILPAAATAIPLAVWLSVVITGASGFSTELPPASDVARVTITYSNMDVWPLREHGYSSVKVTLTDEKEIELFTSLYRQILTPENPGLFLPRTLSSNQQVRQFAENQRQTLWPEKAETGEGLTSNYPDTVFTLETKDGRKISRRLPLNENIRNDCFRALIARNRDYFLAEYSFKTLVDPYAVTGYATPAQYKLEIRPAQNIPPSEWPRWVFDLQKDMGKGEYISPHDFFQMRGLIAGYLLSSSEAERGLYTETAPCVLRVTLLSGGESESPDASLILDYPVNPDRLKPLADFLRQMNQRMR